MSNEKKYSRYRSKVANEKHANLMLKLSEKLTWGVLAVPVIYLAKSEPGKFLGTDILIPYFIIGGPLLLMAIYFQKVGFSILDEVSRK